VMVGGKNGRRRASIRSTGSATNAKGGSNVTRRERWGQMSARGLGRSGKPSVGRFNNGGEVDSRRNERAHVKGTSNGMAERTEGVSTPGCLCLKGSESKKRIDPEHQKETGLSSKGMVSIESDMAKHHTCGSFKSWNN